MHSPPPAIAIRLTSVGMTLLVVWMAGISAGCSGRSIQADNPVLGATPPRMRRNLAQQESMASQPSTASEGDIEQASFVGATDGAVDGADGGIAATVNGTPILISDVLEPHTPRLKAAKEQLTESQFAEIKQQLIEQELPHHIEQAVLVDSALSHLKPEQRKMVEEQLDTYFAEELKRIQAKMGASSLAEVEGILQQSGTSITNLQRSFNNQQLAKQAMGMLVEEQQEPLVNRAELLAEYEKRTEEFTEPEQVRWQQIWISYNKHGGKQEAFEVVDLVVNALRRGANFDEVARQYSDGVKASEGGHWDWTQRGHLANEKIDKMLFELKVGEVGQVVDGENAFHIVRVTEHKPQRTKTFAEVQDQLTKELKQQRQQAMVKQIVDDLKQQAVITTMFDEQDSQTSSATPADSSPVRTPKWAIPEKNKDAS